MPCNSLVRSFYTQAFLSEKQQKGYWILVYFLGFEQVLKPKGNRCGEKE
jgi:hypothetical protein